MDTRNPEKKADLPPRGDRNPDPITDQPGSHPIETGIGAAAAGAAAGMAVGTVAGPIGTAIGAAAGAVVGGLAGKSVGEMIDPTTEDTWLRDNYDSRPYAKSGASFESYHPAYRYGAEAESRHGDEAFESVSDDLRNAWNGADHGGMTW
ncbi:MAG: glycine zipper domain-containing protein, partial [Isosphaeraceae bacterium]